MVLAAIHHVCMLDTNLECHSRALTRVKLKASLSTVRVKENISINIRLSFLVKGGLLNRLIKHQQSEYSRMPQSRVDASEAATISKYC